MRTYEVIYFINCNSTRKSLAEREGNEKSMSQHCKCIPATNLFDRIWLTLFLANGDGRLNWRGCGNIQLCDTGLILSSLPTGF